MKTRYELTPMFDSRKSFYGKAHVERHNDGTLDLVSYTTTVATIPPTGRAVVHGIYSATTTRHTKEFLRQHGVKADTTSDIRSYIAD